MENHNFLRKQLSLFYFIYCSIIRMIIEYLMFTLEQVVMATKYQMLPKTGPCSYTEYAGWAVTTGIPVKFATAHGRSRPEVGSMKCIDVYGRKGVTLAPRTFSTFGKNMMTPTVFLEPIHNFYSLTICS